MVVSVLLGDAFLIAHPWVRDRVEEICKQQRTEIHACDHECVGEDEFTIALRNCVEHEASHARDTKDALDHN